MTEKKEPRFFEKAFPIITFIFGFLTIILGILMILVREKVGLAFFAIGVLLLVCGKNLKAKLRNDQSGNEAKPQKSKTRVWIIAALAVFILGAAYIANPPPTKEETVIDYSKKVLDQYAPNYLYQDSNDGWTVSFNDNDGDGTITVWAPAETPNAQGIYMRACIMFEKQGDRIAAYYVEVDNVEIYRAPRQGDSN